MTLPLRILMIVHGFPPRETAGTEQHVFQLRGALEAKGHAVHVLAATRQPGARQYAQSTGDGVTRIVNNLTSRRLSEAEQDGTIDEIAAAVVARFRPDLIHVHHIQFLSASMRFDVPMVLTLHDRWGWCAAGGLGLLPSGEVCPGPAPERCAPCARTWRPTPGALAQGMRRTAELLRPVIPPDRLHGLYQRIPARLRPRAERGAGPEEQPADAHTRNQIVGDFYRSAAVRISPSAHLAAQAEAQGLGPVQIIPHGVPEGFGTAAAGPRAGLVHLGSIAQHKGTDRVVRAWREACPEGTPSLSLHGPVVDLDAALGHPIGPVLDRAGVARLLGQARALVLAPRWTENAPLVVLEARAMGCPIIAPRSGGFVELVEDGVDGWLFDPDSPAALLAAVRSALEGPLPTPRRPPALRDQVAAIESVYRELLAESPCA